jgi:DNA-binding NarL/FixJ family response regulator
MVNGISGDTASYIGANTQTGQVQGTQATAASQSAGKTTAPGDDTVKLSSTAQARLMLHQGMTVNQIAANLGLSVQSISSALGLTNSSSVAAAPIATPQASSTAK